MNEQEFESQLIKRNRFTRIFFAISVVIFILTAIPSVQVEGFLFFSTRLVLGLIAGVTFACIVCGLRIFEKTPIAWLYLTSGAIVPVTMILIFRRHDDDLLDIQRVYLTLNMLFFMFAIGVGIILSFEDVIERIAKLVRFHQEPPVKVLDLEHDEPQSLK